MTEKERSHRYHAKHREEINARQRAYGATPKRKEYLQEYVRTHASSVDHAKQKHQIKKLYGITVDDYNALVEKQEGRCAICGKHYTEEYRALSIDHDHVTGRVRGLLCNRCNVGLGNFNDDIELMKKAIQYLGGC